MFGVEGVGQCPGQRDQRVVDTFELTGGALGADLHVDTAPHPGHRAIAPTPHPR